MKGFEILHHQRAIKFFVDGKPVAYQFDAEAWERLIHELNNPPDLGIEVEDGITTKEQISGS